MYFELADIGKYEQVIKNALLQDIRTYVLTVK